MSDPRLYDIIVILMCLRGTDTYQWVAGILLQQGFILGTDLLARFQELALQLAVQIPIQLRFAW